MPIFGALTVRPREESSLAGTIMLAFFALWLAADNPGDSIVLDRGGSQAPVAFDHAAHVKALPDPQSPHPTPATATCAGCHHTRDAAGTIQLAKCEGCHGPAGDPRNSQSKAFNEENRKTAFHEMCIGCHADLAKTAPASHTGPVACVDCHKTNARGRV